MLTTGGNYVIQFDDGRYYAIDGFHGFKIVDGFIQIAKTKELKDAYKFTEASQHIKIANDLTLKEPYKVLKIRTKYLVEREILSVTRE